MSDSFVFRLRQSIDLSDPNLKEYEIYISELIGQNIQNNIIVDFTFYESNDIASK